LSIYNGSVKAFLLATALSLTWTAFQQNGHYLFSRAEGYPVFVPDAMHFLDQTLKR
jgi:hypothetical protein